MMNTDDIIIICVCVWRMCIVAKRLIEMFFGMRVLWLPQRTFTTEWQQKVVAQQTKGLYGCIISNHFERAPTTQNTPPFLEILSRPYIVSNLWSKSIQDWYIGWSWRVVITICTFTSALLLLCCFLQRKVSLQANTVKWSIGDSMFSRHSELVTCLIFRLYGNTCSNHQAMFSELFYYTLTWTCERGFSYFNATWYLHLLSTVCAEHTDTVAFPFYLINV